MKKRRPKRKTGKQAPWEGETLRLDLSLCSFLGGQYYVPITFVRAYLLDTKDEDICREFVLPALKKLLKVARRRPR